MKEEKFQTNKYCIYDDDILGTNACTEKSGKLTKIFFNFHQ